jgi:cytochrome c peroxidase
MVILGGLQLPAAPMQSLDQPPESDGALAEEPITPVPEPPPVDPRKIKLGERLFEDPRLSRDNSRSCLSCHDISTNGASAKQHDVGRDGSDLPLNTLTVFNAALSFSFGWEGKISTVESEWPQTGNSSGDRIQSGGLGPVDNCGIPSDSRV